MRISPWLSKWLQGTAPALAMAAALVNTGSALSQAAAAEATAGKYFTKDPTFHLPIKIDDKLRGNIKEVQLWAKAGGSDWQRQQVASATAPNFKYKAPADGEYWFTLVTIDNRGVPTPSDLNRLTPQEIVAVVVDTQAPSFDLQPMRVANGDWLVRCTVSDLNADFKSLKITYQGTDHVVRALEPMPGQPGTFRVNGPEVFATPLRVYVCDLALNATIKDVNLQESVAKLMPAPASSPPPSPQPVVQAVAPTPPASGFKQASGELVTPIGSVVVPTPANGLVSGIPNNVPTVEQRPAPIAPVTTNQPQVGGIQRQFLNTTRASLDYRIDQVGPSGVGKVEVWISADQGAAWKRLGEDADRRSPAEFDLPGDGLYGVRVVVANGNGFGGKPPVAGEQPQLWIDVDTMAPIAQLKEVEPIANGGTLDIRWTVTDKNLGPEPINLYYATRREGPWQPVARGLKNDGLFRWAFPRDAGSQFFVRLEVSDQAGNLARCEAVNAVVLDMTEPRSSVVGVTGVQVGKQ